MVTPLQHHKGALDKCLRVVVVGVSSYLSWRRKWRAHLEGIGVIRFLREFSSKLPSLSSFGIQSIGSSIHSVPSRVKTRRKLREKSPSFLSFLRPIITQPCEDFRNTTSTGKSSSRDVQIVLKGCRDVASSKGIKRDKFGSKAARGVDPISLKETRIPRKLPYHNDNLYDEDRKDKEYAKWVAIENDPLYDEDMKDREYAKWSSLPILDTHENEILKSTTFKDKESQIHELKPFLTLSIPTSLTTLRAFDLIPYGVYCTSYTKCAIISSQDFRTNPFEGEGNDEYGIPYILSPRKRIKKGALAKCLRDVVVGESSYLSWRRKWRAHLEGIGVIRTIGSGRTSIWVEREEEIRRLVSLVEISAHSTGIQALSAEWPHFYMGDGLRVVVAGGELLSFIGGEFKKVFQGNRKASWRNPKVFLEGMLHG
ncbi:hypothetical protein Fmac_028793 [Flemingia macrophylla]|uniref:Uncharacterized protein n=1 Tax=Flemingia macrophylla TaxID=520843 RepID=A0ABD1L8I4_9FABA